MPQPAVPQSSPVAVHKPVKNTYVPRTEGRGAPTCVGVAKTDPEKDAHALYDIIHKGGGRGANDTVINVGPRAAVRRICAWRHASVHTAYSLLASVRTAHSLLAMPALTNVHTDRLSCGGASLPPLVLYTVHCRWLRTGRRSSGNRSESSTPPCMGVTCSQASTLLPRASSSALSWYDCLARWLHSFMV